jgi:CDP-glucose 4,6-dehydratase
MPHPFAAFYRGKRVLVTGHTGFVGGWLVAWLKLLGARVCGYGLPPSARPNFFDATVLDRGITSVFADVRDRDTLANTFADFQPEIIFHAAAQFHSTDPAEIFGTNIMGAINVLEEARLTGCTRAIVVLSGSHRGRHGQDSQASADLLDASHAAAELSALALANSSFRESRTGIATAHMSYLIGGGDWLESRLVPALLHALISEQPIVIHDSSAAFHCCHVLEGSRAYLHLAEDLYTSGPAICAAWNFLPADHETSAEDFAKRFVTNWGREDAQVEVHQSPAAASAGPHIPIKQQPYPSWRPALSLEEAIGWTIAWYKAFDADPATVWRTTEAQIEQYSKLLLSQPAIPRTTTASR